MKKETFLEAMKYVRERRANGAEIHTYDEINNVVRRRMATVPSKNHLPRGFDELIIAMEECGELQQAISKFLRGEGDETHLIEEMGDVYLCMHFIEISLGLKKEDIENAIEVKIENLENIINAAAVHQIFD
jgi:NTP pyrophosphatase (non-canonical NTP hydrolase)